MEYRTIKGPGEDRVIIKRSEFIGHAAPVKTPEEAMAFVAEMRSKYWDASHNVYAYRLREGGLARHSDDGEPSGTAGVPAYDVLVKEEVVDVVVVITRYFGGVLLGAGGLIRAYCAGAKIALDAAGIVTMGLCSILMMELDYSLLAPIQRLLENKGLEAGEIEYGARVTLTVRCRKEQAPALCAEIFDKTGGKVSPIEMGEEYAPVG